jgi:Polyphosphate kinase 2 (PPK2)
MLMLANTTVIKFFLYISKDEQLERFKQRLDDPARHWKISDADYKERELWDDYTLADEDMLSKCMLDQARAVVRDSVQPQMVPQSRGLADHLRDVRGDGHEDAGAVRRHRGDQEALSSGCGGAREAPLEHDSEKWMPFFGKDHAPAMSQSGMTIRRKVIPLAWLPASQTLAAASAG